jgi:division/cell wall cluster transcriptional repressor MraZ
MLIGTYRHSIDSKKRMRMPSKFKSELGSNFVITKGTGNNLFVFSADEFNSLYEKMTAIPLFDVEAQKEAFNMTLNAVMSILSDDAKDYLSEVFGDLNSYITSQIEASVNMNKK